MDLSHGCLEVGDIYLFFNEALRYDGLALKVCCAQAHFMERRVAILGACDAYAEGAAAVGCNLPSDNSGESTVSRDTEQVSESIVCESPADAAEAGSAVSGKAVCEGTKTGAGDNAASEGFRLLLQQLRPRLVAAFDSLE